MKHFATAFILLLLILTSNAQYCGNSGPSVCTPQAVPDSTYWIWVPSGTPDCIVQDSFYSTTLVINNSSYIPFTNASVYVDVIRVDRINNLPCGLCFRTNKTNNLVQHGDSMCVVISGSAESPTGQYNARVVLTMDIGFNHAGGTYTLPLRVRDAQGNCPAIDTASSTGLLADCLVGITEESLDQVKAFFQYDQLMISNLNSPCTLQLFNLQGQQILQTLVTSAYTQACPQLPAGMYIAVLTNASGASRVIRLVKAG